MCIRDRYYLPFRCLMMTLHVRRAPKLIYTCVVYCWFVYGVKFFFILKGGGHSPMSHCIRPYATELRACGTGDMCQWWLVCGPFIRNVLRSCCHRCCICRVSDQLIIDILMLSTMRMFVRESSAGVQYVRLL